MKSDELSERIDEGLQLKSIPAYLRSAYLGISLALNQPGVDEPWIALCKTLIERVARLEAELSAEKARKG